MLEKYIEDFIDDEILDEKATKTYTKYALVARNFKDAMLETKNEEISKKIFDWLQIKDDRKVFNQDCK